MENFSSFHLSHPYHTYHCFSSTQCYSSSFSTKWRWCFPRFLWILTELMAGEWCIAAAYSDATICIWICCIYFLKLFLCFFYLTPVFVVAVCLFVFLFFPCLVIWYEYLKYFVCYNILYTTPYTTQHKHNTIQQQHSVWHSSIAFVLHSAMYIHSSCVAQRRQLLYCCRSSRSRVADIGEA